MSLILVKKKSKKKHISACNRLGLNAFQFATKIHQPHIIPFICGLYTNANHFYLIEDGAKWHQDPRNKKIH